MKKKSNCKIIWQQKICYTALLFIFCFISVTSSFAQSKCGSGEFPSVSFRSSSPSLISSAKERLKTVANSLEANPFCSIIVTSYPQTTKSGQALGQKRIDGIKIYLIEKEGISADRIYTNMEYNGGDPNTVDIKENK